MKEAMVLILCLMFWCVKAAAVSWHAPGGVDESLSWTVSRLRSCNRCFVFTFLPGHLLIQPPASDIMMALLPQCTRHSEQYCYTHTRAHTHHAHAHTLHLPSSHSISDLNKQSRQRPQKAEKGSKNMLDLQVVDRGFKRLKFSIRNLIVSINVYASIMSSLRKVELLLMNTAG